VAAIAAAPFAYLWVQALLVLWALPIGVIGAVAGSARARRRRAHPVPG
jgi:hypothetical protein